MMWKSESYQFEMGKGAKSIVLMFVFPVGVTPFLTTLLFSVVIFCKDICQGLVFVWLQILYGSWKPFYAAFKS